ncbi:hypothetical protein Tco_0499043 [Tanacetum coccineum]
MSSQYNNESADDEDEPQYIKGPELTAEITNIVRSMMPMIVERISKKVREEIMREKQEEERSRKEKLLQASTKRINCTNTPEQFQSMADSASDARKTIVSNLQRELEAEATLANTMLGNLTRYSEQMRIREIQITMLQNMPTMSLNSYGLHALLMTHEADIRTTNNLIRARQELLRSIAEKQNFINNYRAI